MFKNSYKILFSLTLATGTLITISSNSWISSWMGLEINLLAFIPMMSDTKNLFSTESSLKYFLTQALASSVFMLAIITLMSSNSLTDLTSKLLTTTVFLSLLMKMGGAPFHFWFPAVMEGLSWTNALVLMTWQKIAPLALVTYMSVTTPMTLSAMMSVIIGSIGGLNQTSLRKLMAYSSINHIGWMLAAMMSSENLWIMYFMFYSFLSSTVVIIMLLFKVSHFNQLFNMFVLSKPLKFIMFTNLLSLGGLPPFLGFIPKWMVIQYLVQNSQMALMVFMTIFSLITLFFYLRMTFSAFMLNYYETNWNHKNNMNNFNMKLLMATSCLSLMGLPTISTIYLMI